MALFVSERDLETRSALIDLKGGTRKTLFVCGNEANRMEATRSAGHHAVSHRHEPEQLNDVVEGELWAVVGGAARHLKKGGFVRVRGNQLPRAWSRGDVPCTMVQCHAAALDPDSRQGTLRRSAEDAMPAIRKSPKTATEHVAVTERQRRDLAKHGVTA